jgi:hypothetical protein
MPFNLEKAKQIHNNYYDYSHVKYVDVYTKVEIICPKHGSFLQSPKIHIYSKGGCKLCSIERITGSFDFSKARNLHCDFYDYSKVRYQNSMVKVEIVCPLHGSFLQTPDKHLSGCGCPRCKAERIGDFNRLPADQFITRAENFHLHKYNYDQVKYVNMKTRVTILCPKHGEFEQTPNNHLAGNGCPHCSTSVSGSGDRWLSSFNNPNMLREHNLWIEGRRFRVDGFDPQTNTIYEYFGVFWHGCPSYTDHSKINPRTKIPYRHAYEETLKRIECFEQNGYNLIFVWGK